MKFWMLEASAQSLNARMDAVRRAVNQAYNQGPGEYSYCEVVFDIAVIVNKGNRLYRVDYTTGADGEVALADGFVQVQRPGDRLDDYKPIREGSVFGPMPESDGARPGQVLTVATKEGDEKATGKKWGVIIIQEGLSKNRNKYRAKALQEGSALYEGAPVYLDHEEEPRRYGRSTKDKAGFLKDVQPVMLGRGKEGEQRGDQPLLALAGTLVLTKPAVRQEMLEAWEEGDPNYFGLSHDAECVAELVMDPAGAFYDVTRIESVASVDLVTNAAAGGRVLRLVASATVPHTLIEDETMLKELITTIRESKRNDLIAELDALGNSPTDTQVLAIVKKLAEAPKTTEAATTPAAAPTPAAAAVPATTPAAAPTPTTQIQEGVRTVQVNEAEWMETRRDGVTMFMEATVAGCSLPDLVKEDLRNQFTAQIAAAASSDRLPARESITAAVKRQVELFGRLSEGGVMLPANGVPRAQVITTTRDQFNHFLNDFFKVKQDGERTLRDGTKEAIWKVDESKPAISFRQGYVQFTGDTNITGDEKNAPGLAALGLTSGRRSREALDTSSFDQILGEGITRRMLAEYAQAPQAVWRGRIADVVPLADFRTQRRLRYGGYGNLSIVGQGAPYPAMSSPTDEEATYAPAKRGGTEEITLEMITNDDVGAIRRIPTKMARAAAQTLFEFVFDFMRLNATIYDGVALAAAGHGNNITTTAMSTTVINALRQRIKKQTDPGSGKRLGLDPKYIWVPTDLEELAFQLTTSDRVLPDSSIASTAAAAAPNFIRKLGLEPISVSYWDDANDFWVTASVDQTPMIEIGFLGGREEPELFVQDMPNVGSMFSNDKITYKIRHIYGGGVMDFRGFAGAIVA